MTGDEGGDPSVLVAHDTTDGYQCLRSFGRRGFRTILGEDASPGFPPSVTPGATSRYCDETVSLPSPTDDLTGYKDALLRMASREDVRTVLPIREPTAFALSKYREEFEDHVRLAVPPVKRLRNAQDRIRLVETAEEAGVPVPETQLLTDVDDWDRELLVKSRYNLVTDEYVDSYPPNESDCKKHVEHLRVGERPDVDRVIDEMAHVPIVQEFVDWEDEYVVGAICDHGETLASVQLRQIREQSYKGGGGVYRKSVYDPELNRAVEDLLAELDWHGLACIEYMKDANTGEFKLTELNPKTWQSIGPMIRAGADFPYYYWLLADGRADEIDPDYELGVGSHLLKGEATHLASILLEESPRVERPRFSTTAGKIGLSCLLDPRFDILRFDDPLPFLADVYSNTFLAIPEVDFPGRMYRRIKQ